jgi:uncharacterized membrane protein YccC
VNLLTFMRFTRAEMLFSLKSFLAAMLALYVASYSGLPRPFWAVLTAYVVSQPLAGTVRSKALYRFCGTLIGCTATLFLVPALSNAPELLVLALALWVGLCLFLSLLDRGPRAYLFMLAGYTAALIGFPAVDSPLQLFDTAISRVEEIGVGILCATIVHSLVLPVGLAPSLLALLDRTAGDAKRWFTDLLALKPRAPNDARTLADDRQKLAIDLTQLRLLSAHVPFDTGHLRWTAGAIGAMQDAVAGLAPTLSAVEDRLKALTEAEGELAPDITAALAHVAAWIELESSGAPERVRQSEALRAVLQRLGAAGTSAIPGDTSPDDANGIWQRALRIGLGVRLEELVEGWRRCSTLRRTIDAGLAGAAMPVRRASAFGSSVLHRDIGMALLSSFAAILTICLCGVFWIATAWPSGSVATMMAAVFCSFFAAQDDPSPAIHGFLKFTVFSLPISVVYVLLLPMVQDFGMLVLLCAPTLFILGCCIARPATSFPSLAMLFGVVGTLALHDTASADITSFINSNTGQILGIATAALITRLVRSVGAEWSVKRIRSAVWKELGAIAAAPRAQPSHGTFAVRMLDRISLVAPRIVQRDESARNTSAEAALRDLRIGADIITLQRAREELPPVAISSLLRGLTRLFRDRVRKPLAANPQAVLMQLDDALAATLTRGTVALAERRSAIAALVGLRRNLFPEANPLQFPLESAASS